MSILLSEFGDFVEWRFGKEHQEQSVKVANAVNDMQKVKWELGYGDIKNYEYIPDDFVENLLKVGNQCVDSHNSIKRIIILDLTHTYGIINGMALKYYR